MMRTGSDMLILASADAFTWWGLAGFGDVPHYMIMGPLVCLLLCLGAVAVKISVSRGDQLIPQDPSTMGIVDWIRNISESITVAMLDLVDGLMPHHHEGRGYMWLVAPIFLYLLLGNLIGLVPGMLPPTDSVNTNFAVGITVFVLYNVFGFWSVGIGYLRHFWAPSMPGMAGMLIGLVVGPLLLIIELFCHGFRPITLTLRLFGNMTGDHAAFSTFLGLVPIGVPIIFMLMGLLVSAVQAYVFTLLTSVYITLATSHDH